MDCVFRLCSGNFCWNCVLELCAWTLCWACVPTVCARTLCTLGKPELRENGAQLIIFSAATHLPTCYPSIHCVYPTGKTSVCLTVQLLISVKILITPRAPTRAVCFSYTCCAECSACMSSGVRRTKRCAQTQKTGLLHLWVDKKIDENTFPRTAMDVKRNFSSINSTWVAPLVFGKA